LFSTLEETGLFQHQKCQTECARGAASSSSARFVGNMECWRACGALTFALHGGPHVEVREEESIRSGSRECLRATRRYRAVDGGALADSAIGRFGGSVGGQPVVVGGLPIEPRRGLLARASTRERSRPMVRTCLARSGSLRADLATSFAHAFPAASADPVWLDVPFGFAGPSTSMSAR